MDDINEVEVLRERASLLELEVEGLRKVPRNRKLTHGFLLESDDLFFHAMLVIVVVVVGTLFTISSLALSLEIIRTLWNVQWSTASTSTILLVLGIFLVSVLLQGLGFAALLGIGSTARAASMLFRVGLVPIAFIATWVLSGVFGYPLRTLTFGTLIGDMTGLVYIPIVVGLGAIKAVTSVSTDTGRMVCSVGSDIGAVVGPFRTLEMGWRVLKEFAEYVFFPWHFTDLRHRILAVVQSDHNPYNWKGGLNAASYGITIGYFASCTAKGAFQNWNNFFSELFHRAHPPAGLCPISTCCPSK